MNFGDAIDKILGRDPEDGTEQEVNREITPDVELAAARKGAKTLLEAEPAAVAKAIRQRWDRLEADARRRQAQLKVNFLRYKGYTFAQLHPEDPHRVYIPNGAGQRLPPTINKLRRTVHRYEAQVTADEPVIEAVPATHTDEARDQAEASTHVIRGEWYRMKLQNELQRAVQVAAIMRAGFWFFEYDKTAGGRTKAQKFFENPENGHRYLAYVDSSGKEVKTAEEAAEIWQGNMKVHNLTPMNVRYTGGRYAHDARECMVGMLMPLRDVYEMDPKLREVKVGELLCNVPGDAEEWMKDLLGETPRQPPQFEDEALEISGEELADDDNRLDANVFVLHYFQKPGRTYPKGLHVMSAGKHMVFRGPLRYGVIPVAHFKLLEDLSDGVGWSLIDILKDPQELLDFVNGQILRYLQSLRRRWFVPMHSNVKARDLLSPTRSIIEYNPQGGAPIPEVQSEIPNSLINWVDRFQRAYDDEAGMHDTMQGKHVPGVSSGRHAEALRSGDETILGLTRTQIKEGLEAAGRIILEIAKKEWTRPRRVQYFGEDREYVEEAFSAADLGDTSQVRLKRGTLLMLTPAQRLETLFAYANAQVIPPQELRRLAPLADTAGVSLAEDAHYKRARRQNKRFLSGPPEELLRARKEFEEQTAILERQTQDLLTMSTLGADPGMIQAANQRILEDTQALVMGWEAELAKYMPEHRPWEDAPEVAMIHAIEHMRALASDKVDNFPDWWREAFEAHTIQEWQIANPELAAMQAQAAEIPGNPAVTPDIPMEQAA